MHQLPKSGTQQTIPVCIYQYREWIGTGSPSTFTRTWLFSCTSRYATSVSQMHIVRMAQLVEAWTINHAVARSSPSCVKLTKNLQQAFNPKIAESFGSRPKLGGPVYNNNIVSTLKIYLCLLHIGQVLRLPGAVRPDVLRVASLQIRLTVLEVVDTENGVTSNLPFQLYPSSITKMQLQSLVTDS